MKLRITVEGIAYDVDVEMLDGGPVASPMPTIPASVPAARPVAAAPAPMAAAVSAPVGGGGDKVCRAPIAGTVVQVKVKPGDTVSLSQVLLVMEAMKMETNIASPVAGKVKSVRASQGQAVKSGEVLIDFE